MMAFLGPILAAAMIAQFQGGTLEGAVVDEGGKPVADAQVLFFAPAPSGGKLGPVEVRTRTDADGRFRLTVPPLTRVYLAKSRVWAYRAGSGITAAPAHRLSRALILRTSKTRTIKIEGPDGQPVARALVWPRVVYPDADGYVADIPNTLAVPLGVTTGPDGTATLEGLAGGGDQLVAARVTADSVGTQDFQLIERPGRNGQGVTITIRFKQSSRLAGRVRSRAGQPVSNQPVEVWFKGSSLLETNPVGFNGGPLLTAADGSFQTPDNLLAGSSYRVVVRAPGMEPILSDWITIGEKPRVLLPMLQRPLRTVSGRVADRQGKPLAGIEVFQAGDGPERTATKTDADGRFALGGFRQGPVFLFARGDGFRFYGRLVKPGDGDIAVDLTRTNERPTREMRMLPDPIPLEESQALARRLLEPYWAGFENKNESEKAIALRSLLMADPVGVLRKIVEGEVADAREKSLLQHGVARWLARTDPTRAEAVAEAIERPGLRGMARLAVADDLADEQRDRKVALLDLAALQVKAETVPLSRLYHKARIAERMFELGESEKAKSLFAEELPLARQVTNDAHPQRGTIAAVLARVDLPAALAIAKEFPASGTYTATGVLRNIAFGLAADNPAEAERVLRQIPADARRDWFHPMIAGRMAAVDPARARRLTDLSQRYFDHPQTYLFLAHGMKSLDRVAAQQAFQTAMQAIDRLMKDGAEYSLMLESRQVLLPMIEQIDPALVPEYFWRIVATRPSAGNPRSVSEASLSELVVLLAWYDRDVAEVLFEPVRDQMEHTDELALARASTEFLSWSIFDPRAAVARLERVPISPKLDLDADAARQRVAEILRLPHEARWRSIWTDVTAMRELVFPTLW